MSAIPICMAMLQNHAKNMTCQKVNLDMPATGTPVQIRSCATRQKSPMDSTPSLGSIAVDVPGIRGGGRGGAAQAGRRVDRGLVARRTEAEPDRCVDGGRL